MKRFILRNKSNSVFTVLFVLFFSATVIYTSYAYWQSIENASKETNTSIQIGEWDPTYTITIEYFVPPVPNPTK